MKSSKFGKATVSTIKKIIGGRDPQRLVEELIIKIGGDPDDNKKEADNEMMRWVVKLDNDDELEILLENYADVGSATLYMGINILPVPLRNLQETLVAALEIADGLVAARLSLVGHFLVLGSTTPIGDSDLDDLHYGFLVIQSQVQWFRDALAEELEGN